MLRKQQVSGSNPDVGFISGLLVYMASNPLMC